MMFWFLFVFDMIADVYGDLAGGVTTALVAVSILCLYCATSLAMRYHHQQQQWQQRQKDEDTRERSTMELSGRETVENVLRLQRTTLTTPVMNPMADSAQTECRDPEHEIVLSTVDEVETA
jgi:hypothetical protein